MTALPPHWLQLQIFTPSIYFSIWFIIWFISFRHRFFMLSNRFSMSWDSKRWCRATPNGISCICGISASSSFCTPPSVLLFLTSAICWVFWAFKTLYMRFLAIPEMLEVCFINVLGVDCFSVE